MREEVQQGVECRKCGQRIPQLCRDHVCVGETDEYRQAREAVRNQPNFFDYFGVAGERTFSEEESMTSIEKAKHDVTQEALRAVIEVLKGLDEDTQRRVLNTTAVFYNIEPKQVLRGSGKNLRGSGKNLYGEPLEPSVRPGGG